MMSAEAFKSIRGEDVVDPGAYFFHRAVTEHALMMRTEADDSIDRLLLDVTMRRCVTAWSAC